MNIKEHIEAGHYPTDEKGRALVPMRNHGVATIYATDHTDGGMVIAGCVSVAGCERLQHWRADGARETNFNLDLRPPPPRKVKIIEWAVIDARDGHVIRTFGNKIAAMDWKNGPWRAYVVELTGEHEEPWS